MGQRFSIRQMLAAVALASVYLAAFVADQSWYAGLLRIVLILSGPSAVLVLVIAKQGRARAFLIGCLLPMAFSAMHYMNVFVGQCARQVSELFMERGIQQTAWGLASLEALAVSEVIATTKVDFDFALMQWLLAPLIGSFCVAVHWLCSRSEP